MSTDLEQPSGSPRQTRGTSRTAIATTTIHNNQKESHMVDDETFSRGSWMDSFEKLKEFHKTHHHCNVTKLDDPKLWRWVTRQRGERSHYLTAQRRELLDSIGFEWSITRDTNSEVNWEMNFVKLERFLKEGNPCSITRIQEYDKSVGIWAANQRKRHQKQMLRADRLQRLKAIGFDFGEARKSRPQSLGRAQLDRWEQMFQRLLEFKEEHGHVVVPHGYKKDHTLALWVSTQRREYNKKSWCGEERSMRGDRKARLDAIGFVWDNLTKKKDRSSDAMADDSKKKTKTKPVKNVPTSANRSSENVSLNSNNESKKVHLWEV